MSPDYQNQLHVVGTQRQVFARLNKIRGCWSHVDYIMGKVSTKRMPKRHVLAQVQFIRLITQPNYPTQACKLTW
jgi:hypothetical protein